MKCIPLGPARLNAVALVDDADYEWLSQWHWIVSHNGYAVRWTRRDAEGRRRVIRMHRELCAGNPDVDHINANKLDNRRANLRPATRTQNNANAVKRHDGVSRFKGVAFDGRAEPLRKRWIAAIAGVWLGRFATEEEAAAAYAVAAQERFGEFARPASR